MTRLDILGRCMSEAERTAQASLAIGSIASILRGDINRKCEDGEDSGLSLFELDGLATALALISDKLWVEADQLDDMARKQLRED